MNKIERKVIELSQQYIVRANAFNKSLHCSIICHKGFPITYGLNNESAYTRENLGYIHNSLHSEYDAIRKFKKKNLLGKLSECDIYNIRFTRKNEIRNSKPCAICQKHLIRFKIKNIYYSSDEGVFIQYKK